MRERCDEHRPQCDEQENEADAEGLAPGRGGWGHIAIFTIFMETKTIFVKLAPPDRARANTPPRRQTASNRADARQTRRVAAAGGEEVLPGSAASASNLSQLKGVLLIFSLCSRQGAVGREDVPYLGNVFEERASSRQSE